MKIGKIGKIYQEYLIKDDDKINAVLKNNKVRKIYKAYVNFGLGIEENKKNIYIYIYINIYFIIYKKI